jgi:hypothetical protein
MSSGEPSDSSGLLAESSEPWEGLPGLDEVGSPDGALAGADELAGAEVPGEAVGADGSPMMPMAPGAGAGAPGAAAADPSDSSGLLAGEVEEWQAEPGPDEVEAPYGTDAGEDESWAAQSPPEEENEVVFAEPAQVAKTADEAGAQIEAAVEEAQESHANGGHKHEGTVLGGVQVLWGQQPPDSWSAAAAGQPPGDDAPHGSDELAAEVELEPEPGPEPEPETEYTAPPELPGDRVPVLGHDGVSQDPSGWDVGAAAAGAGLFALGMWATRRRRDRDDEVHARIVSGDEGAWQDGGAGPADGREDPEPDGVPGVATWRPNRSAEPTGNGSAAEGRATGAPARRLRLAPPPEGYDPEVASAQAAAAALRPAEDDSENPDAEEESAKNRGVADLLVQDPGMWGAGRGDWEM